MSLSERIKNEQDKSAMLTRSIKRDVELYTEKTHFIYELLQNAEDAEASIVEFIQHSECLEVLHNGKPFTASNIQRLCDTANSDKPRDKIGKFGVGFKSVFNICNTVKVYSEPANRPTENAESRFAIEILNYVDPKDIEEKWALKSPYSTRFLFPYELSYYKSIDALRFDIAEKLRSLGSTVLLFMKHIKEIKYSIIDIGDKYNGNGHYMLESQEIANNCKIKASGKNDNESFLVYSKMIEGTKHTVDIAFSFKEENGKKKFIKTSSPYVSIYFPTETESKLNFIMQGSYESTPNRSSIIPSKDSEINTNLIKLTTELLKEAILDIKSRGWLTLEFLDILPYKQLDLIVWFYEPLRETIKNLLINEEIIPCVDGNYVKAENSIIARGAELIDIFEGQLLCNLIKQPNAKWLQRDFTRDNFRNLYDYFVNGLKIRPIESRNLSRLLRDNIDFLPNFVDDDWLIKFYNYLSEDREKLLDKNGELALVPFVKTTENEFLAPYREDRMPNIFIRPKDAQIEVKKSKFVNESITKNCRYFIELLGLKVPDRYDFFIEKLEIIYMAENLEDEVLLECAKDAIEFLKNNKYEGLVEVLKKYLPLRCFDTKGKRYFIRGDNSLYRENDYNGVSIKNYFTDTDCAVYILDEEFYKGGGIDEKDLKELEVINISTSLYVLGSNKWPAQGSNTWCENLSDFKYHLSLFGFDEVIKIIDSSDCDLARKKSALIFNLLKNEAHQLKGSWKYGLKRPAEIREGRAEVVRLLDEYSWLFTKKGEKVKSSEIAHDDLSVELYGDSNECPQILYDALDFEKAITERIIASQQNDTNAKNAGFKDAEELKRAQELLNLEKTAKENGIDIHELINRETTKKIKPTFPSTKSSNPDCRAGKISEETANPIPKQSEKKERSVRVSGPQIDPKQSLRVMYKNYDEEMVCQICQDKMPFKDKDNQYYFECVEIFNKDNMPIEHDIPYLALCPICAAKYKEFVKHANRDQYPTIKESIKAFDFSSEDYAISINLDKDAEIRFTKQHLRDIQTILELMTDKPIQSAMDIENEG